MTATKQQIIELLRNFAEQRPGIEPGNYSDGTMAGWRAYRAESRAVTRDLHEARELIRAVELSGITADMLREAFRAFSGRLTLTERDGKPALEYCTGQYFPTEYRKAVCAVCAAALWSYKRDFCMPEGSRQGATEGAMLYRYPAGARPGFV